MTSRTERQALLRDFVQLLHRAAVLVPKRFKFTGGNHFQIQSETNHWTSVDLQAPCGDTHGTNVERACIRVMNNRGIVWQLGNLFHGPGPQEYGAATADADGEINTGDMQMGYPSPAYALLAAMVMRLETEV